MKKKILQFDIFEEITPSASRTVTKAFAEAHRIKADYILIHLNTYGGLLDAADSIRTKILESKIPTIVFIDNNAASAGALISISCNKIYMRSGANIGAATVVNETGEALPDKYQSYMRSIMRSTAQARGRDPRIAEAMVDPRTYIPNVNDSGKVLTFTADEAIKNKYCDGKAENISEVLKAENIVDYSIQKFEPSWIDRFIGFLLNPAVSGVLILVMLGGLYFEMQHPGVGLPLILGILAAVLYFAPHYMEGLAANWEIVVFVVGLLLILAEIFVIPGFGVAGISGIVLVIVGLTYSLVNNEGFDFTVSGTEFLMQSLAIVITSMVAMLVLFIFTGSRFMQSKAFHKMVLQDTMNSSEGYLSSDNNALLGKTGKSQTDLRPSGKVIIDDVVYTASAESGYIVKDKTIKVVRNDGVTIVVREG
ncbi:MAG: NfeD family protein [Bacteroidia bacterium]